MGKGQECTNGFLNSGSTSSKFIAFVFGEDTSITVVVVALVLAALFGLAVIGGAVMACRHRDDFRIWVHAKYGYRMCFDKKKR